MHRGDIGPVCLQADGDPGRTAGCGSGGADQNLRTGHRRRRRRRGHDSGEIEENGYPAVPLIDGDQVRISAPVEIVDGDADGLAADAELLRRGELLRRRPAQQAHRIVPPVGGDDVRQAVLIEVGHGEAPRVRADRVAQRQVEGAVTIAAQDDDAIVVRSGEEHVGETVLVDVGGGDGGGRIDHADGAETGEGAVAAGAQENGRGAVAARQQQVEPRIVIQIRGVDGHRARLKDQGLTRGKRAVAVAEEDVHAMRSLGDDGHVEVVVGVETSEHESHRLCRRRSQGQGGGRRIAESRPGRQQHADVAAGAVGHHQIGTGVPVEIARSQGHRCGPRVQGGRDRAERPHSGAGKDGHGAGRAVGGSDVELLVAVEIGDDDRSGTGAAGVRYRRGEADRHSGSGRGAREQPQKRRDDPGRRVAPDDALHTCGTRFSQRTHRGRPPSPRLTCRKDMAPVKYKREASWGGLAGDEAGRGTEAGNREPGIESRSMRSTR